MNFFNLSPQLSPLILLVILIWSMFWKLLALWRASKGDQRYWFIGLLLLNTFGIAEIIYLLRFSKEKISLEDIKKGNFLP